MPKYVGWRPPWEVSIGPRRNSGCLISTIDLVIGKSHFLIKILGLRTIWLSSQCWTSRLKYHPTRIQSDNATAVTYINHGRCTRMYAFMSSTACSGPVHHPHPQKIDKWAFSVISVWNLRTWALQLWCSKPCITSAGMLFVALLASSFNDKLGKCVVRSRDPLDLCSRCSDFMGSVPPDLCLSLSPVGPFVSGHMPSSWLLFAGFNSMAVNVRVLSDRGI